MDFEFIHTHAFKREGEKLGLTLDDMRQIENAIGEDPRRWPTIEGVPGLRKIRIAAGQSSSGKSGGIRVCYFVIDSANHVFLVTVFAKNEKQNISAAERNLFRWITTRIKASYK